MKFERTLLIAEIGINHNGDMDLAEAMIHAAKDAGADAVKFQNYVADEFLSDHTLTYTYRSQGKEVTESQLAMFKRYELTDADLLRLKQCCDRAGVIFFSTPMGKAGVDALMRIGTAYFKNGSDCLGHLPLIRHMARTGVPTILSTGMANEAEIAEAVAAFRGAGGRDLVLLACTSAYPTPSDSVHLRRIPELAKKFNCAAGFSDHTAGWEAAVASVCVGACMIEKHFTTDRYLPGPDHWFSSDPAEFKELTRRVREVEAMLGRPELQPTKIESHARNEYRVTCTAARDLPEGHVVAENDIGFHRPAAGLPPSQLEALLGKKLLRSLKRGDGFRWDCIAA
jgi:N-acetylneuraminate synthase/N,N'-diacetyllegionaminate synthase